MTGIDGLGGGHGTEKIAGVYRVNVLLGKPAPESGDLPVAVVGDQAVVPAVDPAVQIALRLGVADDKYFGHCSYLTSHLLA